MKLHTVTGFLLLFLLPVYGATGGDPQASSASTTPEASAPVAARFSGVLGQSAGGSDRPLSFLGASGLALDAQGALLLASGSEVLRFLVRADGTPVEQARLRVPFSIHAIRGDGEAIFVLGYDQQLVRLRGMALEPVAAVTERLRGKKVQAFGIAGAGMQRGWAKEGKFFVLLDDRVVSFDAEGTRERTLLLPAIRDCRYRTLALEPEDGDLVVGSGYPDQRLYRYAPDGKAVENLCWPQPLNADLLVTLERELWAVGSGRVVRVPLRKESLAERKSWDAPWSYYTTGLARAGEFFWLASSQGLVRYEADGTPTEFRVGGLPGVCALAAAADGTVLAFAENGQRVVRFGIDDRSSMPLRCNGNEPWRIGGGWQGRLSGVAGAAAFFLVAEQNHLWRFDPWHTGWSEKPWIPVTTTPPMSGIRAVGGGDGWFWALDARGFWECSGGDGGQWSPVAQERLDGAAPASWVALAGRGGRSLVATTVEGVEAWQRTAEGTYRRLWQTQVAGIAPAILAATEHWCVVAVGERELCILHAQTGVVAGRVEQAAVPGGFQVSALALLRDWLLVADRAGARLLRFRLTPADYAISEAAGSGAGP